MNVDTQFQPAPFAGNPHRPAQRPPEQVSTRPAEQPHHDEATGKQSRQQSEQVAESNASSATDKAPARGGFDTNPTQPASVGELLDVIA